MQQDDKRSYHGVGQSGHEKNLERLRALLDNSVSLPAAYHQIHQRHFDGRAASSTVEALMYQLREGGIAALKGAPARRRLAALSEAQLHEVCARLQKLNPEIAEPWPADEVRRLLEAWMTQHAR